MTKKEFINAVANGKTDVLQLFLDTVSNIEANYCVIEKFAHSINLSSSESDLRIQLQTDSRYQGFISKAKMRNVLGYEMKVADVADVLKGKIWAYSDEQRRMSKRQKDLADIVRLIEAYPKLAANVPSNIRDRIT